MSFVEQRDHEAWTGEERRAASRATDGVARHGVADYALLAFAALLVLAELAWLSFLGYVVVRWVA